MLVKALKSKIHMAKVTDSQVDYPGSLAIDSNLLEGAGIMPYESVLVADVANGERVETYVIPAEAGSGKVVVLGAAAKLINPGNKVIIMNFGLYSPEELKKLKPKVVVADENNRIKKIL